MAKQSGTSGRLEALPGPLLGQGEATKSINFPRDGGLLRRVQEAAERDRDKFSPTCLRLLEEALDHRDERDRAPDREEAVGLFGGGGLPPWLVDALGEVGRLTGLGIKGAALDILRVNVRDYLEKARADAQSMAAFLRPAGPVQQPPPK